MTSMKIVQFSRPPPPPTCPSTYKILPLSWPGRPISSNPRSSPPPPNDNQSMKRKHNPRMTSICYYVLHSGQLLYSVSTIINLVWFALTSFHLTEVSLSAFLCIFVAGCAVVQKYQEMLFIFNYSHF